MGCHAHVPLDLTTRRTVDTHCCCFFLEFSYWLLIFFKEVFCLLFFRENIGAKNLDDVVAGLC